MLPQVMESGLGLLVVVMAGREKQGSRCAAVTTIESAQDVALAQIGSDLARPTWRVLPHLGAWLSMLPIWANA